MMQKNNKRDALCEEEMDTSEKEKSLAALDKAI
jgi:hypothetical protein